MAITLLQSSKKDVEGVNNTTLAFAQNLNQGSLIHSGISIYQSTAGLSISTPTDTRAHTYLPVANQQNNAANQLHLRSFYVPTTTAGADTVTADISGSANGEIAIINSEWSGLDPDSPLSGTPVVAAQDSTDTPATGTITPADHGCLLIAVLNAGGGQADMDISPSSIADGWLQVQKYEGDNATVNLSVIYKIQTVATPTTASWVLNGDRNCMMHIMAFKPIAVEESAEEEGLSQVSDQIGTDRYRDPIIAATVQAPWVISTGNPFKRITTTVPFDVQHRDVLIGIGLAQTDTVSNYTFYGGGLDWNQLAVQEDDPGVGDTQGLIVLASAVVDFSKRMTVTLTRAVFTGEVTFGALVLVYRDCGGVGTIEKSVDDNATPSISLDVLQPHSDIIVAIVDNDAVDGASRTWRKSAGVIDELLYYFGTMTVYCGVHTNLVRPNRHTVGLLTPGAQQYSMIAAEVMGNPVSDNSVVLSF